MTQVNLYEAKTRLSELVREALAGGEVVIARHGKPVVRIVPYRQTGGVRPGFLKEQVRWSDDFDAPLDEWADYQ